MDNSGSFPYAYGSDLYLIWGWGDRLRAYLSDKPHGTGALETSWMVFRPDRLARQAMARFRVVYPNRIEQIDDSLDYAEKKYTDLANDGYAAYAPASAPFLAAMEDLSRQIDVAVAMIAEDETRQGRKDGTHDSRD